MDIEIYADAYEEMLELYADFLADEQDALEGGEPGGDDWTTALTDEERWLLKDYEEEGL